MIGLLDFLKVPTLRCYDVVLLGVAITIYHVLGRAMVKHAQVIKELLSVVITSMSWNDLPLRLVGREKVRKGVSITADEQAKLLVIWLLASTCHDL